MPIQKLLKPLDFIFIILALFLSFTPNIITAFQYGSQEDSPSMQAVVKINGEVVDTYTLAKGQEIEKTYYPNEGQYNIIQVDGTRIRIKEDNSPDQIGVNTGWISKPGQTAICLPHGFIIEVTGPREEDPLILPLKKASHRSQVSLAISL